MLGWLRSLEEQKEFISRRNWVDDLRSSGVAISPRKRRPGSIAGLWGVDERDERLYATFECYADWFNMIYADSLFRIEERDTAELLVGGNADGPTYGPSYEIFFTDQKFGEFGVSRDLFSDADDAASLVCEIRNAVLLGFGDVSGILYTLHSTIARIDEQLMRSSIDRAMQACLWDQVGSLDSPVSVELSVRGHYGVVADIRSEMRCAQ